MPRPVKEKDFTRSDDRKRKTVAPKSNQGFMTRPNGPVWPNNWRKSMTWPEVFEQARKDRMFENMSEKQKADLDLPPREWKTITMLDVVYSIDIEMASRERRKVTGRVHNS